MGISEWQKDSNYFTHRGHRIFYKTIGKGTPLLLLHGFPTSSYDWHWIWQDLGSKHQVICFDMIGYGYSSKPEKYDYSLFDQADIAEGIIHEMQLKKVHILAHDKGDTVANELIARQNEGKLRFNIKSCVLLNGGLFPGIHKPRMVQRLLMTPFGKYLAAFYTKGMLTNTFERIFGPNTQPTKEEMTAYWSLMELNGGKKVFHQLIYYMQERMDNKERWLKALQESTVPLKLINGAFDPISGKHMANHYKKVIPNPDVVILENIGHYPQIEAPSQVLQHYYAFQERLSQ